MKKVEALLQRDFDHNPFGLAYHGDDGCIFWFDAEVGKVKYNRFSRRIERWVDNERTHVIRAKITTGKWKQLVLSIEAWGRTAAFLEDERIHREKRELLLSEDYDNESVEEGFMKQGINELIREMEIDFHDWKSWEYSEKRKQLEFSDSPDDYCDYAWFPYHIERKENGRKTNHFSVCIPHDEWKQLVDLKKELENA